MNIMNLIHDICLTKTYINNTPKWKVLSVRKLNKKLNEDLNIFLDLDIFATADNTFTFLLSLDRKIISENIKSGLLYNNASFTIEIEDEYYKYLDIEYYPRTNKFEITSYGLSYTIYRNTKPSRYINKMWEPLTDRIKKRYLDIIIQLADYISK